MSVEIPWTVYRTRFLVSALQLTSPLAFTDALGRHHSGQAGDYLVEYSEGLRSITPRAAFEDIYVPLNAIPKNPRDGHPTIQLRTARRGHESNRPGGDWLAASS